MSEDETATKKDLDETRRLLYMALAASRTKRYNLVGTLTNALAHHNSDLDPDEVMEALIPLVNDGQGGDWAKLKIADLNAMLTEVVA